MTDRRLYPAEAADICCLREGEAAEFLGGHPWRRFVVVGDAVSGDLGTLHVSLTSHPAAGDADIYSSDPRRGSMRSHAISAAETIRRLGRHLDSASRSAGRKVGLPAGRSASVPAGAADW